MRASRLLAVLAGGGLLLAGALLAVPQSRGRVKHLAVRGLGFLRNHERRKLPPSGSAFTGLAVSQVGYLPGSPKEFTSPAPFASFVVEEVGTGQVVLRGNGPGRRIESDVLGPIHTAHVGDFSALRVPGQYRLVADDGLRSEPFRVGADVFDAPLLAVQRWFYFQRAFTEVTASNARGPWVHPSDAHLAPPGVRGGWHDAGDYSLYSAPLNAALFWMLQAAADFGPADDDTGIPESGNGIPDLLDEARWGLEWVLSVQERTTGAFRNTTCEKTYGPYGTNALERMAPYQAGEVGTLATARAVGTLAFASTVYARVDTAFARRCLEAARAGQAYLDAHPGVFSDGPTCPAARRDGDAEVGGRALMFASAGMLLATGEPRFQRAFELHFTEPDYDPGFLHLESQASLLYLRAPAAEPGRRQALQRRFAELAAATREEGSKSPFGWATRYHWGSLGAALLRSGLFSVPRCRADPTGAAADCAQALATLNYLMGRNSLRICYVTGLPGVTRAVTHGFHHWLATLAANPRDMPGMIPGGPNAVPEPDDVSVAHGRPIPLWGYWGDPAFPRDGSTPIDGRYTDNDSWSTNEPSIEWEAAAVYHLTFARWLARRGQ